MQRLGIIIILTAFLAVFAGGTVFAGPWLICDPYPADQSVTNFVISIDGGPEFEAPYTEDTFQGTLVAVVYDIGLIDNGAHSFQVKAKNIRGQSDPSPFELPAAPGPLSDKNLRLSE